MQFFGVISVFLTLLALVFFIPVFNAYIHTGIVLKFPTLIVCGFSVIAAIISLFAGLILSAIQHKERREYEFRLQQIDRWYKELKKRV